MQNSGYIMGGGFSLYTYDTDGRLLKSENTSGAGETVYYTWDCDYTDDDDDDTDTPGDLDDDDDDDDDATPAAGGGGGGGCFINSILNR